MSAEGRQCVDELRPVQVQVPRLSVAARTRSNCDHGTRPEHCRHSKSCGSFARSATSLACESWMSVSPRFACPCQALMAEAMDCANAWTDAIHRWRWSCVGSGDGGSHSPGGEVVAVGKAGRARVVTKGLAWSPSSDGMFDAEARFEPFASSWTFRGCSFLEYRRPVRVLFDSDSFSFDRVRRSRLVPSARSSSEDLYIRSAC